MSGGAFEYEEIQEVLADGSVRPRWRKKKSDSPPHEQEALASARPLIVVSDRHLHQIVSDAWQVLLDSNRPPWLFRRGRFIVAIERDDDGRPIIVHLDAVSLRGRLDRLATWVKQAGRDKLQAALPPKEVVDDILALDKPLPILRGLTGTPVFAADGTLISAPGYHQATRLYYEPLGDPVPHIARVPGPADVERAKRLLFDELLFDFPFVDDSSKTHAVAAALTPIVREMIDGPTPLFIIDAPAPGTGKGFLAQAIGIIAFGRPPSVMTTGRGEEEIRKRITAVLREGTPVVLLDNVKGRLESGAFAAVLTATDWTDRMLGKSETLRLPNRALWLVTGNNVALNDEMARRSVWVRLDARMDRPWGRTGFKYDPFPEWVRSVRHELVWALLVLARNWVVQGMPRWEGRLLGSFEGWCRVVGGILATAGIEGFLENREQLYSRVDSETEEWREFVACWWDKHNGALVKSSHLYDLAREWDLLPSILASARGEATDHALKTRLGTALRQRQDRRYVDYFIRRAGKDTHQKGAFYRLERDDDVEEATAAEPAVSACAGSAEAPPGKRPEIDSVAEGAEPAELHFNADREKEEDCIGGEGTSLEVPQPPHVPQTDTDRPLSDAEPSRRVVTFPVKHPHCKGCGRPISVLARKGLCGRCMQLGIVPEWAALVARRQGS